jgi:class 3 adenylate cyclase/tetratricopeptide (TPR) repeat protein
MSEISTLPPLAALPSAAAFAGERKVVTVMFADISGFTALSETLDPEAVRDLMNDCFDYVVPVIEHYGGTVDKFIGDAVMALFGAPNAHENDPERALRAALDIVEAVRQFNTDHSTDLGVHMGINTGLVVAGGIGSQGRQQYSVLGDAVNLAARLEDASERGEILVGPDTARSTMRLFDFAEPRMLALKGKAHPVPVYQLRGRRLMPGRQRGIDGLEAPLVGRERELANLQRALTGLEKGRGQVIYLVGDAGLGKSRLIDELRVVYGDRPCWVEIQALSYQAARPYSLFQLLLRTLARVDELDPPDVVRKQINTMLEELTAEGMAAFPTRARGAIENLLGVAEGAAILEGEHLRRELFTAATAIWRAWAARGPAIIALDDLHWADGASVALLQHLFGLVNESPLLVICAFRLDYQSPIQALRPAAVPYAAPYVSEIELQPLSQAESSTLVDHLLAIADIPQRLRELILAKAEGNPFFVEEVVRELIMQEVVTRSADGLRWHAVADVEQIALPESLQALLTTRIDRLEEAARHVLQIASVIGRTFARATLAQVVGEEVDLERSMATLQTADLIYLVGREPEITYGFRHTLAQEAAYSSILLRRRRRFHHQVGLAIESLYGEQLDEMAHLLAHHFAEADDSSRALIYELRAADAAFKLYAGEEAEEHYRHALAIIQRDPTAVGDGSEASERLVGLFTRLGRVLELGLRWEEAAATYATLIALGQERGDQRLELAGYLASAILRSTPNMLQNSQHAEADGLAALALARSLGDKSSEARVLWALQLATGYGGRTEEALVYGEQSLALARELHLREQMAYTLNDLGLTYLLVRGPAQALEAIDEAHTLWRELNNLPMLVDNLSNFVLVAYLYGDYERAIQVAEEAIRMSRMIGNAWGETISISRLGSLYFERNELARAKAAYEEAVRLGQQVGLPFTASLVAAELAWVQALLGETAQAIRIAEQVRSNSDQIPPQLRSSALAILTQVYLALGDLAATREVIAQCYALGDPHATFNLAAVFLPLTEIELLLIDGQAEAAEARAARLIAEGAQIGMGFGMTNVRYLRARALRELGRLAEAQAELLAAKTLAERIGAWRALDPVLRELQHLPAVTEERTPIDQAA